MPSFAMTRSGAQAATWNLQASGSTAPPDSVFVPASGEEMESAFGEDSRALDGGKYRSIVKVFSKFDKREGGSTWMMGSGWLIRPDLLATAGHVVHDWGRRLGSTTEIRCYIGYSGRASVDEAGVQVRSGKSIATSGEWVSTPNNLHRDVAFVQLDRPFDGNLNLFNYMETPSMGTSVLGIVGYPGDRNQGRDAGTQAYEEFQQVRFDINRSENHMIEYTLSTFGGQDGAPILQKQNGELVAIGCHSGGAAGSDRSVGNTIGGGYGVDYSGFVDLLTNNRSKFGRTDKMHGSNGAGMSADRYSGRSQYRSLSDD